MITALIIIAGAAVGIVNREDGFEIFAISLVISVVTAFIEIPCILWYCLYA